MESKKRHPDKELPAEAVQLLRHGVTKEALRTTLELQDRTDLREVLSSRLWLDDYDDARFVYLHPAGSKRKAQQARNLQQTNLIYSLLLKEAHLLGLAVTEMRPVLAAAELAEEVSYREYASLLGDYEIVFIHDFLLTDSEEPRLPNRIGLELLENAILSAWNEYNTCFVMSGVTSPQTITGGWSRRMIATLMSGQSTMVYPIEGPDPGDG